MAPHAVNASVAQLLGSSCHSKARGIGYQCECMSTRTNPRIIAKLPKRTIAREAIPVSLSQSILPYAPDRSPGIKAAGGAEFQYGYQGWKAARSQPHLLRRYQSRIAATAATVTR